MDRITPEESPMDQELAALWQSGGDVNVEPLIERLQSQNRKLRKLNRFSFIVCVMALVMVVITEFVGGLPTRGLLSVLGGAATAFGWWKYRRDKARLIAAYSEEPGKLLPFLIERTRKMRNLGRYYVFTSLPSVGVGYAAASLFGDDHPVTGDRTALIALVAVGMLILVAITAWGWRLASRKSAELAELERLYEEYLRDQTSQDR